MFFRACPQRNIPLSVCMSDKMTNVNIHNGKVINFSKKLWIKVCIIKYFMYLCREKSSLQRIFAIRFIHLRNRGFMNYSWILEVCLHKKGSYA